MKKRKGFLSSLVDFIWLLIFLSIIYAFIKVNNITDGSTFITMLKLKSYETRACLGQLSKLDSSIPCNLRLKVNISNDDINSSRPQNNRNKDKGSDSPVSDILNPRKKREERELRLSGINTNNSLSIPKEEIEIMLESLEIRELDTNINYNRSDWKHWSSTQSNCWNTREEIMYQQAVKNSIKLLDRKKSPTNNKKIACYIESGKWYSPYDDIDIDKPSKVDVDHTYPLGRAAAMGGDKLTKKEKEAFANDSDNLVAISQRSNRSKGAKGPGEWMPENKDSWCAYSKIYINISNRYKLGITQADKEALIKGLSTCNE